jgi:hypothetical protein
MADNARPTQNYILDMLEGTYRLNEIFMPSRFPDIDPLTDTRFTICKLVPYNLQLTTYNLQLF